MSTNNRQTRSDKAGGGNGIGLGIDRKTTTKRTTNREPTRSIRIGQINLQGSRACLEEMRQIVNEKGIDILLVQEPYSWEGRLPTVNGCRNYYIEGNPKAAILIYNDNLEMVFQKELSTSHHVSGRLYVCNNNVNLVSSYFQFSDDIEPHIQQWERIMRHSGATDSILAGDVNARSPLWFSKEGKMNGAIREGYARGEKLEEFIIAQELIVCNEPGHLPTYVGEIGKQEGNNIDITLRTKGIRISNWRVGDDGNSDHRLIIYELGGQMKINTDQNTPGKLNYKQIDYEQLHKRMKFYLDNPDENLDGLNDKVTDLMTTLLAAAEDSIPRIPNKHKLSTKWWTRELEKERRKVRRMRKNITGRLTNEELTERKRLYRTARNRYFAKIKKVKREAWIKFVSEESANDPWNIPYKVVAEKFKREQTLSSIRFDGEYISDLQRLTEKLLDSLLPSQDPSLTQDESEIEIAAQRCKAEKSSPPICETELTSALQMMGKKKAPGYDEITVEFIKEVWPHIKGRLLSIVNEALRQGKFPEPWKIGLVKVLYKGNDKDQQDANSYRPLTLLPVMGKIYEKVINRRIIVSLESKGRLHPRQYGFRPGRSTEDAIIDVLQTVDNAPEKYVIGIFIDIKGAFDHAWWAKIILQLKEYGIHGSELEVLKDYFRNRYAILKFRGVKAEKRLSMGCPQGSVLGPTLWIVLFDTFLRMRLPGGCHSFAYADDGLLLVAADSRRGLELKAHSATTELLRWSKENRLQLSIRKTKVMMLKGKLPGRPPTVRINNETIQHVQSLKYLGVILDERLSFLPHIKYACRKATDAYYKIGRISKQSWGLKFHEMKTIYFGVGEAILLYGAVAWAHRLENVTYAATLIRAQRMMLLMICKGYRTLSVDALQTMAGIIPIDLKAQQRRALYWFNRSREGNRIDIKNRMLTLWQERWDASEKGRRLYTYWPNIRYRLEMAIEIGHYDTQFMTGHGNFSAYLHRFGFRESPMCTKCEMEDTPEHVIQDCKKYNEARLELAAELAENHMVFDIQEALNTKCGYDILHNWFYRIGKQREDELI